MKIVSGNVRDMSRSCRPGEISAFTDHHIDVSGQVNLRYGYHHAEVRQQIMEVDWPACASDINPTEHVWHQLGRAVQVSLLRRIETGYFMTVNVAALPIIDVMCL
jgi:hypothetical protein